MKMRRRSNQLLVSFVTFDSVSTSTIARWLKTVLEMAGIDVSMFKAHSFRSAAVSAAAKKNCSVKSILQTAGWKSDVNFYKFYHRQELQEKDLSFAKAVFFG